MFGNYDEVAENGWQISEYAPGLHAAGCLLVPDFQSAVRPCFAAVGAIRREMNSNRVQFYDDTNTLRENLYEAAGTMTFNAPLVQKLEVKVIKEADFIEMLR